MDYREHDRRIWAEELEEFVPSRVFDAHCHLDSRAHVAPDSPDFARTEDVKLSTLRAWAATVYPGRDTHFLLLASPRRGIDVEAHNRMVGEEAAKDPLSRAHALATPERSARQIEEEVKRDGFNGLKIYRFYSSTGDIKECRIHEYFPEEQMEAANDLGLWITLHLSRSDGCADEHNLRDLENYTRRYPKIRWILAHCARSFTYYPIRQAIDRLRAMPNIWYDLSAVTDVRPFVTLFRKEDLKRIFYGSDGIFACSYHGKIVTFGRAWQTFYADESGLEFPHCDGRPVLALYEQLLAMKHAAEIAGLSSGDIERIFWKNAHEALGIGDGAAASGSTSTAWR